MSEEQKAIEKHESPMNEDQVRAAIATGKFLALTSVQRDYVLLWLHLKNGYDPLSKAFIFIPGSAKDPEPKLYATAAAAKQEKEKRQLSVSPIYMGPLCAMQWIAGQLTIGAVCEPRLVVSVWQAKDKEGVETWDGSAMALAPEVGGLVNDFKKFITQAQNRTIFRASGSAFMDSSEASDMDRGFGPPPSQPAAPQATRKPAPPRPEAQIPVEGVVEVQAAAVGIMEGVVLEPQAPSPSPFMASATAKVVRPDAPLAKPLPAPGAGAPRPMAQGGAQATPPPGPRALPRSPLPAAVPPPLGKK